MSAWGDMPYPGRQDRQGRSTLRPCPWPGCGKPIRPAYLMCRAHWYRLPAAIRTAVLAAYRPGQTALTATPAYWAARADALEYARQAAGEGEDR